MTANVMEALGHESNGSTAHDDTYVVDGDNVVVLARYTVTNNATGESLAVRVAHHFRGPGRADRPLRAVHRHRQGARRDADVMTATGVLVQEAMHTPTTTSAQAG